MGLFEKIFKRPASEREVQTYFKTLTAYQPVFTSFEGGVYEMALTRAAIHAFATHCSKLKPEVVGTAASGLKNILMYKPNPYQDTAKFLYRLATIFSVHNTAFIAPLYADDMETLTGYYPLLPTQTDIIDVNGTPYLRYTFSSGQRAAIELSRAGILNQFQYRSDFFGEGNRALDVTLQLINAQNQAIINGAKNSATVRFMGRIAQNLKAADIDEERRRFTRDNLSSDNNGGIVLSDAKYADLKQIESKPFLISAPQMQAIKDNVFDYFGTNDKILHNDYTPDQWAAYYEGKIEPWALQLGLVMTNMTFSDRQLGFKNQIYFSSNRLQYASDATKLSVVTQLFDRGMMTQNQGLEIFNLPPSTDPNADKFYIRKEYAEVTQLGAALAEPEPEPDETTQGDDENADKT